jgi:hypothetical protein
MDTTDYDSSPRDNGPFLQLQVQTLVKQKPYFLYNAMFDEVNEGQ